MALGWETGRQPPSRSREWEADKSVYQTGSFFFFFFFFFVKRVIGEVSIEETRSRSFQKLSLTGVAMLLTVHARMEGTRRSGTPCPPRLSWHRLLLPIFCHLATSYTCISDFLLLQVGTHRVFTGLGWQQFITKRGF